MSSNLITDWKIIGRSGKTVDGRDIPAIALEQAAKNYNQSLFTALIWPEHFRWANMGKVVELKALKNNEGGIDLLARIAPNEFYIGANASGQKLFTSMELMPNFRDTKEWYLTGLAATDSPASAATSEMRFNSMTSREALLGIYTQHDPYTLPQDEQPPGWFSKFFNSIAGRTSQDEDMNDADKKALEERFNKLETALLKLSNTNPEPTPAAPAPVDPVTELKLSIEKLSAELAELKQAQAAPAPAPSNTDAYTQLAAELKALRDDFTKAVSTATGTQTPAHTGTGTDVSAYL